MVWIELAKDGMQQRAERCRFDEYGTRLALIVYEIPNIIRLRPQKNDGHFGAGTGQ
jgi:hypothetical protein